MKINKKVEKVKHHRIKQWEKAKYNYKEPKNNKRNTNTKETNLESKPWSIIYCQRQTNMPTHLTNIIFIWLFFTVLVSSNNTINIEMRTILFVHRSCTNG